MQICWAGWKDEGEGQSGQWRERQRHTRRRLSTALMASGGQHQKAVDACEQEPRKMHIGNVADVEALESEGRGQRDGRSAGWQDGKTLVRTSGIERSRHALP